jgi:hypothetical protein
MVVDELGGHLEVLFHLAAIACRSCCVQDPRDVDLTVHGIGRALTSTAELCLTFAGDRVNHLPTNIQQ